jgi:hypothetical protein
MVEDDLEQSGPGDAGNEPATESEGVPPESDPQGPEYGQDGDPGGPRLNQATRLVNLARGSGANFYHNASGRAVVDTSGEGEGLVLVDGPAAREWLHGLFFEAEEQAPSSDAVRQAQHTLADYAKRQAGEVPQEVLDRIKANAEIRHEQEKAAGQNQSLAPYRATPHGLVWIKETGQGAAVEELLTNFDARIDIDIEEDDGVELRHLFELEAEVQGRRHRFSVSASDFKGMTWVLEHLGAKAVVHPGFGLQDRARAAIQLLSPEVRRRRVYVHTGWRKIDDQWVYLHAGGAIGADGVVADVHVALQAPLDRFVLPPPPTGEDLVRAIRTSMGMLEVAPLAATVPDYAAVWRAPLGATDVSVHTTGRTGAGKSEKVALAQQHYGSEMDARLLPGSWSSTGNALEGLAFLAKDALFVVDDFSPTGSTYDVQRAHREADRLLRAQGNNAGRQRMRADASLRPSKPPRGLILSTGEDVPRGESLKARVLVTNLPKEGPGALNWDILTACQREAAEGWYAKALAAYLQWLAPRYETVRADLKKRSAALRDAAYRDGQHRRTPDIVANLGVGLQFFLEFAQHAGAVTGEESQQFWATWWEALGEAAEAQAEHQAGNEPTRRFLELVNAAIASGRAHIARSNGQEPDHCERWGWRSAVVATGDGDWVRAERRPSGERIGWVDGDSLYLEPDAAYAVAQRLARDGGDSLVVTLPTLKRRLKEHRILASTDAKRETTTVRRTLEGAQRNVLHLHIGALNIPPAGEPDKPDIPDSEEREPSGENASAPHTDGAQNVGFVGSAVVGGEDADVGEV